MNLYTEYPGIANLETWSGATYTQQKIIESGKETEFDALLEEIFPEGCDVTELNDFLWFEDSYIYELLNIKED